MYYNAKLHTVATFKTLKKHLMTSTWGFTTEFSKEWMIQFNIFHFWKQITNISKYYYETKLNSSTNLLKLKVLKLIKFTKKILQKFKFL